MIIFYDPTIDSDHPILQEEEAYHAMKVLQKKQGDVIQIVDGKGNFYQAEINSSNYKKCEIKILEKKSTIKRKYHIHIGIAPTKNNERMEFFVEKCTEIGIDEISFLQCERSERKEIKVDRMQKIAIAAMKQSVQAYLPTLHPMKKLSTFFSEAKNETNKFIAHYQSENKNLIDHPSPFSSSLLLIGPEGDFTPNEIEQAIENKFELVNLGNTRLRTETAGMLGCNQIHIINSKIK